MLWSGWTIIWCCFCGLAILRLPLLYFRAKEISITSADVGADFQVSLVASNVFVVTTISRGMFVWRLSRVEDSYPRFTSASPGRFELTRTKHNDVSSPCSQTSITITNPTTNPKQQATTQLLTKPIHHQYRDVFLLLIDLVRVQKRGQKADVKLATHYVKYVKRG